MITGENETRVVKDWAGGRREGTRGRANERMLGYEGSNEELIFILPTIKTRV